MGLITPEIRAGVRIGLPSGKALYGQKTQKQSIAATF
jgi:hypothetical protein